MKKMSIMFILVMSLVTATSQSFSMASDVPEQKAEAPVRNHLFDQAAEQKRMRRLDLKVRTIQVLAAQQAVQGRCDVSCGCLGAEQATHCLAAGFPFSVVGSLWQLFGCGKRVVR